MFVRADHPDFDADQLMRHEAGHAQIRRGEIDLDSVRREIAKRFTSQELDEASANYAAAYEGSGMSAEEIWEEVVCDSLGDMNIFAAMGEKGEQNSAYLAEVKTPPNKRRRPAARQEQVKISAERKEISGMSKEEKKMTEEQEELLTKRIMAYSGATKEQMEIPDEEVKPLVDSLTEWLKEKQQSKLKKEEPEA